MSASHNRGARDPRRRPEGFKKQVSPRQAFKWVHDVVLVMAKERGRDERDSCSGPRTFGAASVATKENRR